MTARIDSREETVVVGGRRPRHTDAIERRRVVVQRPSDLEPWYGFLLFWSDREGARRPKVVRGGSGASTAPRPSRHNVVQVSPEFVHLATPGVVITLAEHPHARVRSFDPAERSIGSRPTAVILTRTPGMSER